VNLLKVTNEILLEIADNGIGIEKEELENIFGQFYRVGSELTRSAQGTGLGLFISLETIKAHGGTITAFSEGRDKGVKFVIKLKESDKIEKTAAG
jgi:signal transduction histidine kinase